MTCPGCYPTAALLALEPLVEARLVDDTSEIFIDAKSGISGAGRKPSLRTHFSECHGNVTAYGIFDHRHGAEIEQELEHAVTFVPHLVPAGPRNPGNDLHHVRSDTTEDTIADVFERAYADAPFVRLRGPELPEIAHVAHTNYCDIGWRVDQGTGTPRHGVVCRQLVKGAAGQASSA